MAEYYRFREFFSYEKTIMNIANCKKALTQNSTLLKSLIRGTYLFLILGTFFAIVSAFIFISTQSLLYTILAAIVSFCLYLLFIYKRYYLGALFSVVLDAIGDNRDVDSDTFNHFKEILDKRLFSVISFDVLLFIRNSFLPLLTYLGLFFLGNYIMLNLIQEQTSFFIFAGTYSAIISLIFIFLFFRNNFLHKISTFVLLDIFRKYGFHTSEAEELYESLRLGSQLTPLLKMNIYDVSLEFHNHVSFIPTEAMKFSSKLHRFLSKIPVVGGLLATVALHIEYFQDPYMIGIREFIKYAYYSNVYEYTRIQCIGVGKAWVNEDFYSI